MSKWDLTDFRKQLRDMVYPLHARTCQSGVAGKNHENCMLGEGVFDSADASGVYLYETLAFDSKTAEAVHKALARHESENSGLVEDVNATKDIAQVLSAEKNLLAEVHDLLPDHKHAGRRVEWVP